MYLYQDSNEDNVAEWLRRDTRINRWPGGSCNPRPRMQRRSDVVSSEAQVRILPLSFVRVQWTVADIFVVLNPQAQF